MTTLYRPVLIETAEQAEALPIGTVIHRNIGDRTETGSRANIPDGSTFDGGFARWTSEAAIGWTALVPIEAEEVRVIASGGLERDYHGATVFNHTPDGPRRDYRRTEFHTPWESA